MFQSRQIEGSRSRGDAGSGNGGRALLALTTSALVLAGAAAPVFFAADYKLGYAVDTVLLIDAPDLSKAQRQQALTDAGKAVRAAASLDDMVATLKLGRDQEFAVAAPGPLAILSDIVTGKAMTVAATDAVLRERLSSTFTAKPDASVSRLTVTAKAGRAKTAADIADAVAGSYRREIAGAAARSAGALAQSLERAMQNAENAVAQARAQLGDPDVLRRAEHERQMLAQDIAALETNVSKLREDAKTVDATSASDVLTKPLSSAFDFSGIDQMRQLHLDAKILVDQLSASLGPRHPRLLAAQAALGEMHGKIETALMRLAASLRQREESAVRELADLKGREKTMAAAQETPQAAALAELEAKAEKARQDYLAAVRRLDAASNAGAISATTVKPADPASARMHGFPMWVLSLMGALAGFGVAMILAFAGWARAAGNRYRQTGFDDENQPDFFDGEEIDLLDPATFTDRQAQVAPQPAAIAAPAPAARPVRVYHAQAGARFRSGQVFHGDAPEPADPLPMPAVSATPLADRVRELLLANRMRETEAEVHLPPLVAAVMAGGVVAAPRVEGEDDAGGWAERPSVTMAETDAPGNDIMALRERVALFGARRSAGQR
ncbi:hypothetical protein ACQKKX_17450 [Neorhizobium sp. NPDC001467]|uniref:hypothetical protein n=1 Tax=Neorhizobium sp. NPDC001467 TaxID=3390595 RepID=UPI003D008162